jgi:hypothetical protein
MMPRAKLPPGATKEVFAQYKALADAEGETNDCTIRAVSQITETPYQQVLALYTKHGRKPGTGASIIVTKKVLDELGFKAETLDLQSFNPAARKARGKFGITSHHPDRFPSMWRGTGKLLVWNRTHMWAVVDGVNLDWSRGKSLRVDCISRITKV